MSVGLLPLLQPAPSPVTDNPYVPGGLCPPRVVTTDIAPPAPDTTYGAPSAPSPCLPAKSTPRKPVVVKLTTPTEDIYSLLGQYAPITLDEIYSQAALLKRVDRKYLLRSTDAIRLFEHLRHTGARALEIDGKRNFHYISDYFDTENFDLYHAAATKRRRRYKVRERFYCDSGEHFLEVKIRDGRGNNVKKRLKCGQVSPATVRNLRTEVDAPYTFSFDGSDEGQWIAQLLAEKDIVAPETAEKTVKKLQPCVRTAYTRSTLLLPDGLRLTCDINVQTSSLMGEHYTTGADIVQGKIPFVILETKSSQRASAADKLLWSWGVRPIKISKYAFAVATHHKQKANKWTRAFRRINEAS